jgi:thioredoxin 1
LTAVRSVGAAEFAALCTPGTTAVVAFVATWNRRCQAFMPAYQALAARSPAHVAVTCVDVDESPDLVSQFEVCSVPTVLLLRDGQVVWRDAGLSLAGIEAELNGA